MIECQAVNAREMKYEARVEIANRGESYLGKFLKFETLLSNLPKVSTDLSSGLHQVRKCSGH